MSTIPDSESRAHGERASESAAASFVAMSTALVVLGLSSIWFTVVSLWTLWTTDALKSIGMLVPPVSLLLLLWVWRRLGWPTEGTWWGAVLLLGTAIIAWVQQQSVVILVISPRWATLLPPPSLMLFAYGSGAVLLLGGVRLYRAAWFPIALLLLANPIPHVFTSLVDLPLQHASAHVARAFAMRLGHSLTPDNLRLMFTPDFGMFIAPGCNGIRGSMTMGFIALIAGYVYRFRWRAHVLVVLGAVLLGYVFNLARLCLLVLYYAVALHFPSLQGKAEMGDYVIGGTLFLIATLLLFAAIHRLRDSGGESVAPPGRTADKERPVRMRAARLATMGAVVAIGLAGMVRARNATNPYMWSATNTAAFHFPAHLGNYTMTRSWDETLTAGRVVYTWAQYAPAGGGTSVAIGVSPILGWHDPLICHFTRGEQPLWHGQLDITTADAAPIHFSSSFYNDGATQYIEAGTICDGGTCGEFATDRTHFGLIYTRPDARSLLGEVRQPVPVMLRVETLDATMPADRAREQLTGTLRGFLASVRLDDLVQPAAR